MADQFETFNRQAEQVQRYPLLNQQELEDIFREVDQLLRLGLRALLQTTHFVEDNLCHRLAEIAIGSLKAKIYRGRYVKSRRRVGQGIEIGSENQKILGIGFDLFKLSRTARDIAMPLVQRVLRSLRLQNNTYEQILRAFCTTTQDYRRTCEQLALRQQQLRLAERRDEKNLVPLMQQISELIDQKRSTESRAGCVDANRLYGTTAQTHRYIRQIDRLQDRIVKAYLRSIPRIVREYAQSDLDALDLFQAGSFGLLHAVKVYDYRSRAGFARIARTWIRQRIRKALQRSSGPLIQLAPNVWEEAQKIRRAREHLMRESPGVEPDRARIADHLGWSVGKVEQILEHFNTCQVISLDDETQTDTETIEREATIADDRDEEAEELEQHRQQVEQIINHLRPEDQRLICLHYGCTELIRNDEIDASQVLEEMLRQLACKTLVHQYLAGRIDNSGVPAEPISEEDEKK